MSDQVIFNNLCVQVQKLGKFIEEDKQVRSQFFEGYDKDLKGLEQKINEKYDNLAQVFLYKKQKKLDSQRN